MSIRLVVTAAVVAAALAGASPRASDETPRRLTGRVSVYAVRPGDTLRSIGSRVGVDPGTLAADNQTQPNATLQAGTSLRIDDRHIVPEAAAATTIVVNVPQRMLFHVGESAITGLPAAVGRRDWKTPTGAFEIRTKEKNPTWEVPVSILEEARRAGKALPAVVPPGPANPLGKFWLGLTMGGVGIHGTNAPLSIYQATTHGCIRLHPDDIAWLFERVHRGTVGRFVYEPVLLTVDEGDVFLEVHRDLYGHMPGLLDAARDLAAARGVADRIDWEEAARVAALRHGVARRVSR